MKHGKNNLPIYIPTKYTKKKSLTLVNPMRKSANTNTLTRSFNIFRLDYF